MAPPDFYAACPGGEGAVLKTVGPRGLAGSNPVRGASLARIGSVRCLVSRSPDGWCCES